MGKVDLLREAQSTYCARPKHCRRVLKVKSLVLSSQVCPYASTIFPLRVYSRTRLRAGIYLAPSVFFFSTTCVSLCIPPLPLSSFRPYPHFQLCPLPLLSGDVLSTLAHTEALLVLPRYLDPSPLAYFT